MRPARRPARSTGHPRVGYVGAEFTVAPARHFLRPFIEAHDRGRVEVFAYDTNAKPNATRPPYLDGRDRWRHVPAAKDDELLTLIERDRIDVLVDIAGHFPGNRLSVFGRRPAAVQAAFPRYPCTTGCPQIDYLFSDRWTSPEGSDDNYVEAVHRLSSGYLAYAPPEEAGPIRELPLLRNGYVTFGVIQRPVKLSTGMWDLFAEVLQANPGSRLLLHYGDDELDDPDSPTSCGARSQLRHRDVDPSRLVPAGRRPMHEHLELLSTMDIALDTYPFAGQTTTSECLWMGVPVVALAGDTHASRVAAGLVSRMGLEELATQSVEAYVAAATKLAGDVARLQTIRRSLRERAACAGFTDGTAVARGMEEAYLTWSQCA
jgi:predicted O-linked N-acetylglucosamine transferase (SPINDLY family)